MGTVIQFRNRDVYCGSYFDYLAGRALLMSLREIFSGRSGDMLSPSQRRVAGRPVPVNTYKTFYHREWDIVSIFRTILRAGVFYLRIARDQKHSSIATEYQLYTDNDCLVQMPVKVPLTLFAAMCDKYAYSFAALNLIAQAIDSERNTARPVLPKPAEDGPATATGPMYIIAQDMLRKYDKEPMTNTTIQAIADEVSRIVACNFYWIASAIVSQKARTGDQTPTTQESVVSDIMRLIARLMINSIEYVNP